MTAGTKKLVELGTIDDVEKVATLIYNSGVSQIVKEAMEKQFPAAGFDIVANEIFEPTATDITVQLEKIRATNPDIHLLSAVEPGVVTAITGLRDIGWDITGLADASSAPTAPT